MTDEYEALWDAAEDAYNDALRECDGESPLTRAASVLREAFEAKLADRDRTIAEQAAEIERLKAEADDRRDYTPDEIEIFQRCFDRGILDIDDLIHGTKAEKLARAQAALGGSNAK